MSSLSDTLRRAVASLLRDWRDEAREASWGQELMAAITVASMSVPQGVAYALIAGLPPAVGLVAGGIPAIVGSMFRSSRHVVSGPTNALSLLVGTSVAAQFDDPVVASATLAVLVGLLQMAASVLRLGAVVDYVSAAVVTGYITGAGILIGAGQLANVTGTPGVRGDLLTQLSNWVSTLGDTHLPTLTLALATIALILGLRQVVSKSAAALVAVSLGVVAAVGFGLGDHGVRLIRDLASISQGLPPLQLPDVTLVGSLVPIALAGVLLSLVESTSVARSIAGRTGQQLDLGLEFFGMGLANLASGLFGSFPVSGSLSRSAINEQSGAKTRYAGALSGVLILVVLLGLGPLVDLMPIASLAGLLVVVAADLVDVRRIRRLLRATVSDRFAFLGTLVGTWVLPLDQAIAVGVGVNVILFLRQAQSLLVRELIVDEEAMRLREVELSEVPEGQCRAIRILHLEGPLFFGAAGALEKAVRPILADDRARFLVVRLKRTRGL
ncbi:MAG: SulP family inorganic anion transporter, partial [Myxococcota bacterium]